MFRKRLAGFFDQNMLASVVEGLAGRGQQLEAGVLAAELPDDFAGGGAHLVRRPRVAGVDQLFDFLWGRSRTQRKPPVTP